MEEFSIQYRGFTPASSTKQFFQTLIRRIQDDAPDCSFIRASFAHDHGEYKGIININSEAGRFLSFAQTADPKELGTQLYEKLREQLNEWKTRRFRDEGVASGIAL